MLLLACVAVTSALPDAENGNAKYMYGETSLAQLQEIPAEPADSNGRPRVVWLGLGPGKSELPSQESEPQRKRQLVNHDDWVSGSCKTNNKCACEHDGHGDGHCHTGREHCEYHGYKMCEAICPKHVKWPDECEKKDISTCEGCA